MTAPVRSKPHISPNTNELAPHWKYQAEFHVVGVGQFLGFGSSPFDAVDDLYLQYEMFSDPDLHK